MSPTEHLIVFTRYPVPGKTKTRLIPALGAEGAATLQCQMTEHTLLQARSLRIARPLSIEVRFTDGADSQMQRWLGSDVIYQSQGSGDLGARMAQAFQAAFAAGLQRVVVIGTDCPELGAAKLLQAFEALKSQDVVLGPATDGGYYLIGLRRFIPQLFTGIAWGTASVLEQTVTAAKKLELAIAELQPLTDVDRPEDLEVWQRVQGASAFPDTARISIIIPLLNESQTIERTLAQIPRSPVLEIIGVDGGSQDQTLEIANSYGIRVIQTEAGRAHQMNAGAQAATGDILLFLHADTRLPDGFIALVHQVLAQPGTVAGAFELKIDGPQVGLRLVEWGVNARSRYLQLPYGDQAIFLKAKTFHEVGGFPDLPIMEDFEFVRSLRQQGRIAIAPAIVLTSGRRWQRLGIWQTTLLNQIIIAAYFLGVSPGRIARWYRRDRDIY